MEELKEPEWKPIEERTYADRCAYVDFLSEQNKRVMKEVFRKLCQPANQLRGVHIWTHGKFHQEGGTEFKTVLQKYGAIIQDSPTADTQWLIADNCFVFSLLNQNERQAYRRLEQRHMHGPYIFFKSIMPWLLKGINFHE